jgi:hypothetical protein
MSNKNRLDIVGCVVGFVRRGEAGTPRNVPDFFFDDQPLARGTNPAMLSRKAGIRYDVHSYDLKKLRVRVTL